MLILLATWGGAFYLIKRDINYRAGVSSAVWIPTLWVGIIASRPFSSWIGASGGTNTLEGSPVDRLFLFSLIVAAACVLGRRHVNWSSFAAQNWILLLFYGFLLVSVVWAYSPITSFKRWFKESGNILMVLTILTEVNPLSALRAVFVRCAYVLLPLSVVYVRYFPDLGRRYNGHTGMLEVTGVTAQKNTLGAMVLVCSLMLIWDYLERRSKTGRPRAHFAFYQWTSWLIGMLGLWLLHQSDSKTSMLCLAVGSAILISAHISVLRARVAALGVYAMAAVAGLAALDSMFGISRSIVEKLGRDMTFTGRTDVWRELLGAGTDPLVGTGFMSFWDDPTYRAALPEWVAVSAHNGYIEIFLAGGLVACSLLGLLLLSTALRINKALAAGEEHAVARFAILCVALIANFSESNFACMTPIGFLFLVASIGAVECIDAYHHALFPRGAQPDVARPSLSHS